LAALSRRERLARAIEQADIDGKCPIAETVAMYEELRKPGKPGFKTLGQILRCRRDDFEIPGGHLERLFRRLLRKYGLAEPTWQAPLPWNESRRADGIWYPQKALLELDSRTWHGRIDQMTADRQRDREARRHGLEPYRFTYEEVKYTPANVVAEVRAILDTSGVNRPVPDRSIDSRARETG
jgi:very-short-patch-repair endonuclease